MPEHEADVAGQWSCYEEFTPSVAILEGAVREAIEVLDAVSTLHRSDRDACQEAAGMLRASSDGHAHDLIGVCVRIDGQLADLRARVAALAGIVEAQGVVHRQHLGEVAAAGVTLGADAKRRYGRANKVLPLSVASAAAEVESVLMGLALSENDL